MRYDLDNLLQMLDTTLCGMLLALDNGDIEQARHRCRGTLHCIRVVIGLRKEKTENLKQEGETSC